MRKRSFRIVFYREAMNNDTAIRPFSIDVQDSEVADLTERIRRTRWPARSPEAGWSRGVPLDYLQALARFWADGFDWRRQEAALNEIPQFVTTINGQDIHFLHVRSPEPGAIPLLITHGWPSSPFEFLSVIGPLTDPRAHGGDPADAFELIIPSLPGYGFSTPVTGDNAGNLFQVAGQWAELMTRLGYQRFAVHGTDVGAGVAGMLAMINADRIVGIHLTGTAAGTPFGPPVELTGLSDNDQARAQRFNAFRENGQGYLQIQSTKPQTISYALADSPVGQLAWMVEKFQDWTDPGATLPEDAIGRDQLLTVVSICWFTNSGASSAHAMYDGIAAWKAMADQWSGAAEHGSDDHGSDDHGSGGGAPTGPPTGYAVFAADSTIRALADPGGQLDHWSEFDRGGHFPAMETPDLLVGDLRAFFSRHR
jgi:pimeloyl-ACP methyl ester carboxylesterase